MALWSNTDANTSAPKYAPSLVQLSPTQNNVNLMYGNTTTDAFITGQTIGLFGVSANEMQGNGNVSTVSVTASGGSAYGLPTVTITGANTTQATATVNVKIVSATINSAGTGYANGNTVFAHVGANTTRGVLTVTDINSGTGAVLGLSITTAGAYSTITGANAVTFLANNASGTGLTANLRYGLTSVTVAAANAGEQYNRATVGATATANGIVGAAFAVTLSGQDGSGNATAGWNLRKLGSGGRAGRETYECLVAMGSMTADGADDSQFAE
jgi:hypothetical protein